MKMNIYMRCNLFVWVIACLSALTGSTAEAQQTKKLPRIGWLTGGTLSSAQHRVEALRQGLRELGYVEGKNVVIEWRGADRHRDRIAVLAAEFVRLKVDVIVTASEQVARASREATSTIPIVMASSEDPVGTGLVASLARPGGNITGLSQLTPELSGKRLEILKEVVPTLSRLAVFGTSSSVGQALVIKEIERAAAAFGIKPQYIDVLTTKAIEPAFRAAVKGRNEGVIDNIAGSIRTAARKELSKFAVKYRLPVMWERPEQVEADGLMSYGINLRDLDRRAATYIDKILKGRTPADLPIEQPMKFDFVINLGAAKAINLTIPPNVLVRATKVIR